MTDERWAASVSVDYSYKVTMTIEWNENVSYIQGNDVELYNKRIRGI